MFTAACESTSTFTVRSSTTFPQFPNNNYYDLLSFLFSFKLRVIKRGKKGRKERNNLESGLERMNICISESLINHGIFYLFVCWFFSLAIKTLLWNIENPRERGMSLCMWFVFVLFGILLIRDCEEDWKQQHH